jgi:hypothetical protein
VSADEQNIARTSAGSRAGLLRLRQDDLNWRVVEGEVIILDDQGATYYAATGAAATLWPLLVAGCTAEALAERLRDVFGIDMAVARNDVAAFVSDLETHRLL